MTAEWTITDAWLLSAVAGSDATTGSTLIDVISAADAINHAIPAEEEFARSMGRLVEAGVVDADLRVDRFWLTDAGQELRGRWRGGLFGWIDTIPPGLRALGPPKDTGWALPPKVYPHAVREYQARTATMLRPKRAREP
jgi:hypothetical protein